MALHTELSIDISAHGESTKENCNFGLKFENKVLDTLVVESSARVPLVASASDVEFDLQGVTTGQLVLIKTEATDGVSVKINGVGNPAITLKPQTNTETNIVTPGFLAMLADGITSLHFANLSSSEAVEVDVALAGV